MHTLTNTLTLPLSRRRHVGFTVTILVPSILKAIIDGLRRVRISHYLGLSQDLVRVRPVQAIGLII
jgi:ParB-like chromosome segregation protein Spo0J